MMQVWYCCVWSGNSVNIGATPTKVGANESSKENKNGCNNEHQCWIKIKNVDTQNPDEDDDHDGDNDKDDKDDNHNNIAATPTKVRAKESSKGGGAPKDFSKVRRGKNSWFAVWVLNPKKL